MSQLGFDGIGLHLLRLGHFVISSTLDEWILRFGSWSDSGRWADNAKWKD